jgi:hypothetical protein
MNRARATNSRHAWQEDFDAQTLSVTAKARPRYQLFEGLGVRTPGPFHLSAIDPYQPHANGGFLVGIDLQRSRALALLRGEPTSRSLSPGATTVTSWPARET